MPLSPGGKITNCHNWGDYEPMNASPAAALCHGGMWGGDSYGPCQARFECKVAREQKMGQRSLPVYQPGAFSSGLRTVATTPNLGTTPTASSFPNTRVPVNVPQQQRPMFGGPIPVVPPETYPHSMSTPYVQHSVQGTATPTFLPEAEEGIVARILKNIFQGFVGSTGWQIFSMSMAVDFFKKRKKNDPVHPA